MTQVTDRLFDGIDAMIEWLRARNEAGDFTEKVLQFTRINKRFENLPVAVFLLANEQDTNRHLRGSDVSAEVQICIIIGAQNPEEDQRRLRRLKNQIQQAIYKGSTQAGTHWLPTGVSYDLTPKDDEAPPAIRAYIRCEVKYRESGQS